MNRIEIYDTTLRDGMQAEGISFSLQDKLLIAKCLDDFGVDYIEGGYAASNEKEMAFFHEAANLGLKNSLIAGFGNTRRASASLEEDLSLKAILNSKAPVATIVGKSWDMHVTEVLRCSLEDNLALCSDSTAYLKSKGLRVVFDAEHFFDGYKHNPQYSLKVLEAAAAAGADVICLCETNGGCLPRDVYEITKTVADAISGPIIGIHCHNDTDCAVANSLAAIEAGARHVQGTINGMGERTGNANLCSIIPNLKYKMGYEVLKEGALQKLTEVSRYVQEIANMQPVANMPYVGDSAFAHKAGLHVNALMKNKATYEHISPEMVGNARKLLISELSGMSNILAKLEKYNLSNDRDLARKMLDKVQEMESNGYQFEAAEASFDLLIKKTLGTYKETFHLVKYHVNVERSGSGEKTTEATIKLTVDGETEHVVSEGDGPVNALDEAMRKSLERFYPSLADMRLVDYKVRVVNAKAATAAKVRVTIESRDKNDIWGTVGVSENIIDASWKALKDSFEYKIIKDAQESR
ncbi:2-isopropylmalate synthase [Limihaloglobus sulfuriphilus]|uniref:Citramalate synthase n=1 Tax=Limihaloglobus sulfuriphilus TaxID=1851148 RepID=A0A1Q2MDR6_9BACT|nr:citramalate synthase [Limihaloglobus sulfuriphilus]AQQ70835.1 2-isopropylmalate synthase [Limihaloglobus sulfuriphilus]